MFFLHTNTAEAINVNFMDGHKQTPVVEVKTNEQVILQKKNTSFSWRIKKVSTVEKIFLTRHFVTMFEAGISLIEAMQIAIEESDNKYLKNSLENIYVQLQNGQPFSASLATYPKIFNKLYVKMVAVGEQSGRLAEVLAYLLRQQEDEYRLYTRIRNALIYPVTTLVVMIMMVIGMLLFVVPEIAKIYLEEGIVLPLFTRVLIDTSSFVVSNGLYIFGSLSLLILAIIQALKTERGHALFSRIGLRLPVFGKLIIYINLSRFTRTLSDLIESGISMDQALEAISGVVGNSMYKKSLSEAVTNVQRGVALSACLRAYPQLFPPLVNRMTVVGEKSGNIDSMYKRVAQHYEDLILNATSNLSSLIEPILILLVGTLVGSIAVAILFPIWNFAKVI